MTAYRNLLDFNRLCVGMEVPYDCARAIEGFQARIYPQLFDRMGHQLVLNLRDGDKVTFRDSLEEGFESFRLYSLRDYLQEIDYFIVHLELYEGEIFFMINRRDGKQYDFPDLPVLSPDTSRIVVASGGIVFNTTSLTISKIGSEGLDEEWHFSFRDDVQQWYPSDPIWLDDQTIQLAQIIEDESEERLEKNLLLLTRKADTWLLSDSSGWPVEGEISGKNSDNGP